MSEMSRFFRYTEKDRRFGEANQYLTLEAQNTDGEKEYYIFTEVEVETARRRANDAVERVQAEMKERGW